MVLYRIKQFKRTLLWLYIVIKGKQGVDDSVPRYFFTELPRRTKDLQLSIHTESSQMDITEKSTHSDQKTKEYTKVQYTTLILEPYNSTLYKTVFYDLSLKLIVFFSSKNIFCIVWLILTQFQGSQVVFLVHFLTFERNVPIDQYKTI